MRRPRRGCTQTWPPPDKKSKFPVEVFSPACDPPVLQVSTLALRRGGWIREPRALRRHYDLVPIHCRRSGGCVCPERPDDSTFPPQVRAPMASPVADASRRRREKRRQLDARRSKCRIRLGGHMEQWCLLKERLGFSLHSQLAKFLLDRLGAGRDWGGHPGTAPSRFLQPWVSCLGRVGLLLPSKPQRMGGL